MLNPFVVKKYMAYLILAGLPTVGTVIGIVQYGVNNGALIGGFCMIVGGFIANWLLDNPFRQMLEGKGILTIGMDSTGVLDFTVLGISNGRMRGFIFGNRVDVPYDQNLVHTFYTPELENDGSILYTDKEKQKELLIVDMSKLRRFRFGFSQYPCLVYNKVTKSLVPKDMLGDIEKKLASHLIFIANERSKDLATAMLGFSRSVVDAERFTQGKGDWIKRLLIIGAVVLMGFFLWKFLAGGGSSAITNAVGSVADTAQVINPR